MSYNSFQPLLDTQEYDYQADMLDSLKEKVFPTVFQRGVNYYKNDYIREFNVKKLKNDKFKITGKIKGTKLYSLRIISKIGENQDLFLESSCSCPYDWGPVCKHMVAILVKFIKEDFSSVGREFLNKKKYNKLLDISQVKQNIQQHQLSYRVKGFIDEDLVNFKLVFNSEMVPDKIINQLINELNEDISYYGYDLEDYFSIKEFDKLQKIKNLNTQKSRSKNSLLIRKNEVSFNLMQELMENFTVIFEETDRKAKKGEDLRPEIIVKGNEEKIFFEIEDFDYKVYSDRYDNINWSVIDNKVHLINYSIYDELPDSLAVPQEKRGELLFEVLPALSEKFSLKVDDNLNSYELIKQEPEIFIQFDYKDKKIFCYSKVEIEDEFFKNTEILGFDFDSQEYIQDDEEPKIWYTTDYESMENLINLLEEYDFRVKKEGFFLEQKDKIQEFITDGFVHLPEEWEIQTTDAFNSIEIEEIELEPVIEFEDVEDDEGNIDWFEFAITYNLGGNTYTREEIMNMISYNKDGDPYIHVNDKYYILESKKKEDKIENILELADKEDDQKYQSPFYNILYYQNLIKEAGINIKENRVFNELEKDITEETLVKEVKIPDNIEDTLRDYQKRGYYWLRFLSKYHFGGILADDMGLGKTVQALTLIKSVSLKNPSLIVCPRTLIYNWQEEVNKFFPETDCFVYYGSPEEREEMRSQFNNQEMIITSYSIISRDFADFKDENFVFSYCILDEAQKIKNHKTKRAKAVKSLKAQKKLALTGTPLENSVEELWSIFDFLMKGYLGNFSYFRKNYLNPINKENDQEKMQELKEKVAPFILRRHKQEVLEELPEKLINIQTVNMTKLQEDSYQYVLDEVKGNLKATISEKGFNRSRINVLAALTRLRQICNHPGLVLGKEGLKQDSGKMEYLLELIKDGIDSGHKIILFSQFVKMLKLIRKKFEKEEITYEYLDGGTRNRMERVNKFNNNREIDTFLISLKAGGTGLNLTGADMVVHVDPWWNPMVERQATDRTHRIGQENNVIVYKLITKGTVEEKMLKLQKRKKNIFDNVIENNKNPLKAITWEDIQELLEY